LISASRSLAAAEAVLSPEVLVSIANLELRARLAVEGFLTGLHRSPFTGFNVEFNDYRKYYQGDDLRHLDWRLYARTEKLYIKQYEDETNVRGYLLLDASGSMAYGSGGYSKFEYARTLAASLAYFMMQQQDAVGLTTFNREIRDYLPPRFRKTHLMCILTTLAGLQARDVTDLTAPLSQLFVNLTRRSLIVVISDLLDEEQQAIALLQQLRSAGHDIIVFHVLDHAELTFPFARVAEFVDMERGGRITTSPAAIRERYVAAVAQFCDRCRSELLAASIDYCLLDTSAPLSGALAAYLTKRSRHH